MAQQSTGLVGLSLVDFRLWDRANFMFAETAPPFPIFYTLDGRNGVGKSSILEAIIFALTGRDSSGGQHPTHLIRSGESRAVVTLETFDWIIERSMTLKGNGTLKIARIAGSGIMNQVTQTELRNMLGMSEQLMIATIVPGFFMSQPMDKRLAILSEVIPRLDRNELLSQMCGLPTDFIRSAVGDLNSMQKIPHYTVVANKRLEKQKSLGVLEGKIESCRQLIEKDLLCPIPPDELYMYDAIEAAIEAKARYQEELMHYARHKNFRESVLEENAKRKQRERRLIEEISDCIETETPHQVDWSEYDRLKACLKEYPEKPRDRHLPDSDYCPVCGQAVSIAYKDKIRQEDEDEYETYRHVVRGIDEYNKSIREALDNAYSENMRKEAENKDLERRIKFKNAIRVSLERQLADCAPMPIPEEVEPPKPPETAISAEEVKRIKSVCQEYYKERGSYESDFEAKREAKAFLQNTLMMNYDHLSRVIADYELLEVALRDLPEKEVSVQGSLFGVRLPGIRVLTDDGIHILDTNGVPYACMSSGQKMRVGVELCISLQELAQKMPGEFIARPSAIFIDNFDLADWKGDLDFPSTIRDVFLAHVDSDKPRLVLDNFRTITTFELGTSPQAPQS